MLKRRLFWLMLLVALGLGSAMLWWYQPRRVVAPAVAVAAAQSAVIEFLASDIVTAGQRDLRQTLQVSGALRALNQASLKAKVSGTVSAVNVREGEAVRSGQILIEMERADYAARVLQARGALLAAQGQLDIAVKSRDNNRALLDRGFISRNAFDNAASQFDIAKANLDSARGGLDLAQKALADTVIQAPIAGLVSSRSVQPGEKVAPDNRLLDIVDLSQMEMEASVPAAEIAGIAIGQTAAVHIEGIDAAFAGTVVRVNPATQAGSRSILVYIRIANPQQILRVGMFGNARLTLAQKKQVLTLPQSALRQNGQQFFVYAIENDRLVQKPVKVGMRGEDESGNAVEIVSGLAVGARVVKTNLGELRVGTAVRVLAAH